MQLLFQNLNKYVLILVLCALSFKFLGQQPAISINAGYAISTLTGNDIGPYAPLINSINNGITAEYIFKTEQVGLAIEGGYLRKGLKDIIIINNLSFCFKIKRYYKNKILLSMGIGYDYFINHEINYNFSSNYTTNTILLKNFDFYIQPTFGYTIFKRDNLSISPNIGFDFSFFPINIHNTVPHNGLPLLYNRYSFLNINVQYRFKKTRELN